MRCENLFCIYWSKENICILDKIELDIQGRCESCIYVDIEESSLSNIRKTKLNAITNQISASDSNIK